MALRITGVGEEIAAVAGLPWNQSLEVWPEDPQLAEKRGISRHIVRLVRSTDDPDSEVYAVKETVSEFANREYKILRELKQLDAPSVQSVAVVEGRTDNDGEELPCALVTRFLPYSLPYRVLLSGKDVTVEDVTLMANALALLLVRLHLLGFWWGDCSLSNTLFRRDAEGFAAYLVDAETGEFQKSLSDGQREHDLEIAHFNVAAELEDLALSGVLYAGMDPIRASNALIKMQLASKPAVFPPYDEALLAREMQLFPDWYVTKHLKATLTDAQQQVMNKTFAMLNANILAQPKVYVHRDYHSRNLMVQENSHDLGVLDFQDAVYGPITYDLVSLLKDAYISWEEDQILDWAVRYWQSARQAGLPMSEDFAEFYRDFEWMGAQRHIKVLGVFARLYHRDGKDGYLKDMPLVMDYLRKVCERYIELNPMLKLLNQIEGKQAQVGYTF